MNVRSFSLPLVLLATYFYSPDTLSAGSTQPASQPKRLIPTGRPAGKLPLTEMGSAAYVPCEVPEGVKAIRNIEYAKVAGKALLLDLYIPESTSEPMPVVLWIHGGGWRAGTKAACRALPLTRHGYAAASIEYRLSGVATWPAQIHDCKAAVRWLRAHAGEYGLDPDRIGVWGHAAGGHLAALLGTSGDVKELEGDQGNLEHSSRVQAVCEWFGPSDLPALTEELENPEVSPYIYKVAGRLLGGALIENVERARQTSPVTFVSEDDPPFLIIHGDKDKIVPLGQSQTLHRDLKRAGVDATLFTVKGAGHARRGYTDPEISRTIEEFFDRTLKNAETSSHGRDSWHPAKSPVGG